jgi:hypothetical protein
MPPLLEIVRVWPWLVTGGAVVVVVLLAVVVVVDDDVVDDFPEFLSGFVLVVISAGLPVVAVVVVASGAGAVVVVDDCTAAGPALGSARVPAVAPGRGSGLAGDVGAGDDVAPSVGLDGVPSVGRDWGAWVSGAETAGSATSTSGPSETLRAAWRARRTSGCDNGETRLVEKRDETSWTPNNPRSTPLAVPRAHVTTRTRRIQLMVRGGTP